MSQRKYTPEAIELIRDRKFRRNKYLQVHSIDESLDFINETGFCFAFSAKNSELPCLWHAACGQREPVMPEHTHHDPYVSLVWTAKDDLPARKAVYYGKVLKKRPTFISLKYLPYFYALSEANQGPDAYLVQFMRGELSLAAKKIMDSLSEHSPQITRDLKITSGHSNPDQRYTFDQAMAELQMKMYVVKIAEFYEPFTFLWELVPNRYPEEIEKAKIISPAQARFEILAQYFQNVIVSSEILIQRLFTWQREDIKFALDDLEKQGIIQKGIEIEGERGNWVGTKSFQVIDEI